MASQGCRTPVPPTLVFSFVLLFVSHTVLLINTPFAYFHLNSFCFSIKQQLLPDNRWQVTDLWGTEEHFHVAIQLSPHTAEKLTPLLERDATAHGAGLRMAPRAICPAPPGQRHQEVAPGRGGPTMKDDDSERGPSSQLEGGPPRLLNAHAGHGLRPENVHGQAQRISCLCYPRLGWGSSKGNSEFAWGAEFQ